MPLRGWRKRRLERRRSSQGAAAASPAASSANLGAAAGPAPHPHAYPPPRTVSQSSDLALSPSSQLAIDAQYMPVGPGTGRRLSQPQRLLAAAPPPLPRRQRMHTISVRLARGHFGLGVSLVDGRNLPAELHGILGTAGVFIDYIDPEGAVADDGNLRVYDRILQVNSLNIEGIHTPVATVYAELQAEPVVEVTVARGLDDDIKRTLSEHSATDTLQRTASHISQVSGRSVHTLQGQWHDDGELMRTASQTELGAASMLQADGRYTPTHSGGRPPQWLSRASPHPPPAFPALPASAHAGDALARSSSYIDQRSVSYSHAPATARQRQDHFNVQLDSQGNYKVRLPKIRGTLGLDLERRDVGILVAGVREPGAAHLDGRIRPGDLLLSIDGIAVDTFDSVQVASLLRHAGEIVELKLARRSEQPRRGEDLAEAGVADAHRAWAAMSPAPIPFSGDAAADELLTRAMSYHAGQPPPARAPQLALPPAGSSSSSSRSLRSAPRPDMQLATQTQTSEHYDDFGGGVLTPPRASAASRPKKAPPKMVSIMLKRPSGSSFGFTVAGVDRSEDLAVGKQGVIVTSITSGGVVANDGRLKVDDQLLNVNGQNLLNETPERARDLLKAAGSRLNLIVARPAATTSSEPSSSLAHTQSMLEPQVSTPQPALRPGPGPGLHTSMVDDMMLRRTVSYAASPDAGPARGAAAGDELQRSASHYVGSPSAAGQLVPYMDYQQQISPWHAQVARDLGISLDPNRVRQREDAYQRMRAARRSGQSGSMTSLTSVHNELSDLGHLREMRSRPRDGDFDTSDPYTGRMHPAKQTPTSTETVLWCTRFADRFFELLRIFRPPQEGLGIKVDMGILPGRPCHLAGSDPTCSFVRVTSMAADKPGYLGGMQVGDAIMMVNSTPLYGLAYAKACKVVSQQPTGEMLAVVARKAEDRIYEYMLAVQLDANGSAEPMFALHVRSIDAFRRGVFVRAVATLHKPLPSVEAKLSYPGLYPGDRVLFVNNRCVEGLELVNVQQTLSQSAVVTMVVVRRATLDGHEWSAMDGRLRAVHTPNPNILAEREMQHKGHQQHEAHQPQRLPEAAVQSPPHAHRPQAKLHPAAASGLASSVGPLTIEPAPPSAAASSLLVQRQGSGGSGSEGETTSEPPLVREVVLTRMSPEQGFGFNLLGPTSSTDTPGIFIAGVAADGPADRTGDVNVGDEVIAANGIRIDNFSHSEVLKMLRGAGTRLTLALCADASSTQRYAERIAALRQTFGGESRQGTPDRQRRASRDSAVIDAAQPSTTAAGSSPVRPLNKKHSGSSVSISSTSSQARIKIPPPPPPAPAADAPEAQESAKTKRPRVMERGWRGTSVVAILEPEQPEQAKVAAHDVRVAFAEPSEEQGDRGRSGGRRGMPSPSLDFEIQTPIPAHLAADIPGSPHGSSSFGEEEEDNPALMEPKRMSAVRTRYGTRTDLGLQAGAPVLAPLEEANGNVDGDGDGDDSFVSLVPTMDASPKEQRRHSAAATSTHDKPPPPPLPSSRRRSSGSGAGSGFIASTLVKTPDKPEVGGADADPYASSAPTPIPRRDSTAIEIDIALSDDAPMLGLMLTCARSNVVNGEQLLVKDVVPGQAAWMDGRIRKRDILLELNGKSLCNMTQHDAVPLIREATAVAKRTGQPIQLKLRRRQRPVSAAVGAGAADAETRRPSGVVVAPEERRLVASNRRASFSDSTHEDGGSAGPCANSETRLQLAGVPEEAEEVAPAEAPRVVHLHRDNNGSIGCSIVGGEAKVRSLSRKHAASVYIANVTPGGMAEQAGLQAGDQLLKVGDELVTGLAHEKIIELIKTMPAPVRMTVRFHAQGYREFIAARKAVRGSIQRRVPQSDESMVRNTNSPGGSGPEGDDTVTINLLRTANGLGFSIYGGAEVANLGGVFVQDISPGGAAHASGELHSGDQLISINGEAVAHRKLTDVVRMLKGAGEEVTLVVRSAASARPNLRSAAFPGDDTDA